ncbi:MAG: thiol-disulfide oxidoreductase DCC family protein [Saprospiraceae bacterium]|nr:thiol-disulfide oxidoreductase DCC family protein [Saprospiraceae bacterium]MCF8251579.1 thiol-disulfide oxidoreductase DCC family protein [Saprospiraceae bacterium]MCF8282820.1 thiol-disulfide oxidoreductase DCC family protein [Bacteroidales bacterium]MCF8313474.1 thiol-disulfide oxidoreductase DCC family protein [Saprospiraceae bacterium]MCF8442215.1 thiol-disulfide oxidoreductase DCC family protein [Saprospiraceae bacterium]
MPTIQHPVLLFDGVCNLCNDSVQWVIRHDPEAKFRFVSLQSATGEELLQAHNLPTNEINTVVLIDGKKAYTRSDVPLRIFGKIGGGWPLLGALRIVPRFIRDAVYNWVARNRYRWFGKKEACWLPTPELKSRFL